MTVTVKHPFVSAVADSADTSLVRPSNWNADHTIIGLGTAAEKDVGVANGVASLDSGGKVPVSELPAAVLGALSYQGTWNASTNTPTLASGVGTKGYYYVVSVAGSTNLDGITSWVVGDWAVYNGTAWQKVDNTDAVTSVNGYTGTVVLSQADIAGTVPTSRTISAGTGLTGGGDLSADRTFAIDSTVATLTGTQTLTNKTVTSPKINEILDANGNEVLGLLSTASATDYVGIKNGIGVGVPLHISSEGSSANIGLHIQPKGTGLVTISDGTDFNKGIRFRSSSSAASAITLLDAVSTAGHVITLPDATTTLVGRNTTDTLTNKSISGATNTFSSIPNSGLTNSSITINGVAVSLGSSTSVGTVTSVTGTAPVVSSGGAAPAISLNAAYGDTLNPYASKTANFVLAAPTGVAGVPTFRAVVAADIPTLNQNTTGTAANVTGVVAIANGGTGASTRQNAMDALAGSVTSGQYLRGNGTDVLMSAIQAADVPTLNQNTTGTAANVTGVVVAANGGTGLSVVGTTGNVLTSNGSAWVSSAPVSGNITTKGLYENAAIISANYTIGTGNNAISAGPITINSGVVVTVPSGSVWTVV